MGKIKTVATVFELPQRLGILQHVEYEPPPREWCTNDGCLYEGVLTAEGCKRGVCVKYRVWVFSRDGRRWEAKGRWRRRDEEAGGRLRQQVADALWELAERGYDIAVDDEFNVVINGVAVSRPRCRTADGCVKQMLEEYRKKLESPPPPRRSPEEEEYEALLQRYLWLRWWNKNAVLDALRHGRHALLDILHRLNSPEVPHFIAAFLGRFELDFRCVIAVYKYEDIYCVEFCIKDSRLATYCYERGCGWYAAAQRPKFQRLKPLEDGRLVEVYVAEGKELIRIA